MNGSVGELIGKLYVEATFPPESKARMLALVDNLRRAFAQSIDSLDWMSAATKDEARRKLAKITVKIGYPDRWRDYGALTIRRDDLFGNVRRANEFEFNRQIAKLGGPLDRDEWLMTPQTVNAYYYPPMNEIVFPAAILRPPFFRSHADDAVNYGGIGGVIDTRSATRSTTRGVSSTATATCATGGPSTTTPGSAHARGAAHRPVRRLHRARCTRSSTAS